MCVCTVEGICIYIYIFIYIYIKNKTFIIRSYISVSSKPSKTQ